MCSKQRKGKQEEMPQTLHTLITFLRFFFNETKPLIFLFTSGVSPESRVLCRGVSRGPRDIPFRSQLSHDIKYDSTFPSAGFPGKPEVAPLHVPIWGRFPSEDLDMFQTNTPMQRGACGYFLIILSQFFLTHGSEGFAGTFHVVPRISMEISLWLG